MTIPSRIPPVGGVWKMAVFGVALLFVLTLGAGCAGTAGVKTGDTVRVHYTAAIQGNPPFEGNMNGTPLEFTLGSGQMIPGFEGAVKGMTPGQTKEVTIPADQAYGLRNESLVGEVDTSALKEVMNRLEQYGELKPRMVQGIDEPIWIYQGPGNQVMYYRFTNITAETTVVDQNHFLAGKDLEFTITLVEIVK